jgi:hypothetical protein
MIHLLGYIRHMNGWEPVKRGKVNVRGLAQESSGIEALDVRITLSAPPPAQWVVFFSEPETVDLEIDAHINGATVVVQPADDMLEAYVAEVDRRITDSNARYENEILPELQRREDQKQAQVNERERRLEDARRRAEAL